MVFTRTPMLGQITGNGKRHADHTGLAGAISGLPNLAIIGGDRGRIDHHAASTKGVFGRIFCHLFCT